MTPSKRSAVIYFAPLVSKPDIIDSPGKYKTRSGETVTIKLASKRHDFGCFGHYSNGIPENWHKSGRIYATSETGNDIIEKICSL